METVAGRSTGDDDVERSLIDFVERNVVVDGGRVGMDSAGGRGGGGGGGGGGEERLVESGRVDSIGLLQILGYVAEKFEVDLLVLGAPRDLLSVAALAAAVRRETAARSRTAAEGA